ncbi:tyrosinase family protein [Pedobacter gandavensis]|uniref:tyrosinase family protein n=1 Tax=Pedobacter gandavensis TaxID=2679963 RepID=UPI00292E0F01|nr:tyrosinase family protein [Pedobacter gandavensis]
MKFILKINGSESENAAYIGWTPVKCTLTIDGYTGDSPMPVTITPEHRNKTGRIDLYLNNSANETPIQKIEHDFKTKNELIFYVAGKFEHSSVLEKDVFISVKSDNTDLKLEKDIMVQVRKNANKLTDDEINLFLEAFVRLNTEKTKKEYLGNYSRTPSKLLHEIVLMHTYDAVNEIHQRTSFHPWHRIFNMHLERELQAIFPQVTIPYWKFDKKAERVFTSKFIGETEKYDPEAPQEMQPKFDKMNPLVNYVENTVWGTLNRAYQDRNPANQDTFGRVNGKRDVLTEKEIVNEGPDNFEGWSEHEERKSHNSAHNVFAGDVADVGKDPIDPLFFMMHSNVDRLWAKWQHMYNRFDGHQMETYPHPDKYEGKRGEEWIEEWKQNATQEELDFFDENGFYMQTNKDIGNFLEDTLWPWDLDTDDSRPMRKYKPGVDPEFGEGNMPEIEIEFPKSPTSNYPNGPITVKSTIDFQGRLNNNTPLGFDYDDIPYFDQDRKPSTEFAMDNLKDGDLLPKDNEKQLWTLSQLKNNESDLSERLKAIGSIDETSEVFLDTILDIIADSDAPVDLRVDLINRMVAAKRENIFYPSRKPRFFNILRGLIDNQNKKLRFQAIGILTANQDSVVQKFLIDEINKTESDLISKSDAIFFLRQNPKPQHASLFLELYNQSKDPEVKRAAIAGLGNDPESKQLLIKIVLDGEEDFKIREAAALSLQHLDHEKMNDLAAEILLKPKKGNGIKLFKSVSPTTDEVDFKAGLLNMLTFTGDINSLKQNEGLKNSLNELVATKTSNKAKFLSSVESVSAVPLAGPTIIEQMAAKLLKRLEGNHNE